MLRCTTSIYANCNTYFLLFNRALCEGDNNEPRNEIMLFLRETISSLVHRPCFCYNIIFGFFLNSISNVMHSSNVLL